VRRETARETGREERMRGVVARFEVRAETLRGRRAVRPAAEARQRAEGFEARASMRGRPAIVRLRGAE
jgi:hypothetical protein